MPLYDYKYTDTGEVIELFHGMTGSLSTHPDNGRAIERIYSVPNMSVDSKAPKTVGELAAKNTAEMVKRGDKRIKKKKKAPRPWWRPDKDKPLNTRGMSQKQIEQYIRTGEKK